jgi:hypothetical protein
MDILVPAKELEIYFNSKIDSLKVQHNETKAYIYSVFSGFVTKKIPEEDNITITYINAKSKFNFIEFQTAGDYILYIKSFFPEHLNKNSINYYDQIAMESYYCCHIIMNRQLPLFEELSKDFTRITKKLRV